MFLFRSSSLESVHALMLFLNCYRFIFSLFQFYFILHINLSISISNFNVNFHCIFASLILKTRSLNNTHFVKLNWYCMLNIFCQFWCSAFTLGFYPVLSLISTSAQLDCTNGVVIYASGSNQINGKFVFICSPGHSWTHPRTTG